MNTQDEDNRFLGRIDFIRLLRSKFGLGLREAHDLVVVRGAGKSNKEIYADAEARYKTAGFSCIVKVLTHEIDEAGDTHRLVAEMDDGRIVRSAWADNFQPAVLDQRDLDGTNKPLEGWPDDPTSGYLAFTKACRGLTARIIKFEQTQVQERIIDEPRG